MDRDSDFSMTKDERLNGNNYPIWSFRIKQSFIEKKIWYVTRDDTPPTLAAHGLLELGRAPSANEIQAARSKALYLLSKAMEDRILARFTRIEDPSELWTQLRNCCASNTTTRRGVLKRKLSVFKFSDSVSMTQNFSKLTELLNELAAVDITYIDDELHLVVLDALPPSWETFGSMLALTGRQQLPTFAELENLVKEEETRRNSRAFAGDQAMYVRHQSGPRDHRRSDSSFRGPSRGGRGYGRSRGFGRGPPR